MGVSGRELARQLGVTNTAVIRAKKERRITPEPDGTFDVDKARTQWGENTDPTHGRNALNGFPKGIAAEDPSRATRISAVRLQLEAFKAALARLQYQKLSGQLVAAAEVKQAAFNEARRCRDQLLAIPDRVAPIFAGLDDPAEIHRLLTEELRRALSELSGDREDES